MQAAGDTYEQLATYVLAEQQRVLGAQASQIVDGISGIHVDADGAVAIDGDGKAAIGRLAQEFRALFGTNVDEALLTAIVTLDHAVELPASLDLEHAVRGYTEYRDGTNWQTAAAFEDVEPEPTVWRRLFGFDLTDDATSAGDGEPIAARRGVPLDASDTVHDAWCAQADTDSIMATGHTWVTAAEIPDRLTATATSDLVRHLLATTEQYGPDCARLIVWLRYGTGL